MSSMYAPNSGEVEGRLSFASAGRMIPTDVLSFHPEFQRILDEIEERGWKYLYIETIGSCKAEINLAGSNFKIEPRFCPIYKYRLDLEYPHLFRKTCSK